MALGFTRNISLGGGGKVASAEGGQPSHLHMPTVLKSGGLNLLEPLGLVQACNGIAFTFVHIILLHSGQQYVSFTHVAIFKVVRARIQMYLKRTYITVQFTAYHIVFR
jgi:hypothetical protein